MYFWGTTGARLRLRLVRQRRGQTFMNLFVVRTWLQARLTNTERGASMVEYILLVSLIAIAVIGAVAFMRTQLQSSFSDAGSRVSNAPNP